MKEIKHFENIKYYLGLAVQLVSVIYNMQGKYRYQIKSILFQCTASLHCTTGGLPGCKHADYNEGNKQYIRFKKYLIVFPS